MHPTKPPTPTTQAARSARVFGIGRTAPIRAIGTSTGGWQEVYYFLVSASWGKLALVIVALYLLLNALFGAIYLVVGGVENARPGSFEDAFFFSVQTMATIGYGFMYPKSSGALVVMTFESLLGIVVVALLTGLTFAKFAQPRARVIFSNRALIALRDGRPTLMLRVANERRNHIAEATCRLSMLRSETTKEGEFVRRVHDLQLVRSQQPSFVLSWTVLHVIDESSPLFGLTAEELVRSDVQILATLTGLDSVLTQTVHARYAYLAEEVLWNKRFSDVIRVADDGDRVIDYRRFHDIEELAPNVPRV